MKKKSGWRLIVPVVSLFALAAVVMYIGDNGLDKIVASGVTQGAETEYIAGEVGVDDTDGTQVAGVFGNEVGGDIRERVYAAAKGDNSLSEAADTVKNSASESQLPGNTSEQANQSATDDESVQTEDEQDVTNGEDNTVAGTSPVEDTDTSADTSAVTEDAHEPVRTADGKHIQIAGTEYDLQYPVRTYIIAGTDGSGNLMAIGDDYYGDFTDTIMALVVDDHRKTVGAVQIDRNTMVNVPVLDYQGNEAYTYFMQICIASIYGGNMDKGEKNVCRCVSELFGGMDINGYYAIPVGAMSELNDTVGGVKVTMPVDFTDINSEYEKGATVTLYGADAERFVRARSGVEDGLNRSRMRRQAIYMKAFTDTVHERLADDSRFANDLFTTMRHVTYTNIALDELISGLIELDGYENLGILTPTGKAEIRETFNDGIKLEENYMDYNSLQMILEKLYPLQKIAG